MPEGIISMLIALAGVGFLALIFSGSIVPLLVVGAVAWALISVTQGLFG